MNNTNFTRAINLANPRLVAAVTYATDDFFADKARMIDPAEPVFIEGKYDDNGKWMDGWESRRKRTPGHDHCVVKLGQAGIIQGVDIDTSHFTGNYPPAAMIEVCVSDDDIPADDTDWKELVPRTELKGDSHHLLAVESDEAWTHIRLHIYPDGGVARLRIYGIFHRNWQAEDFSREHDLLAAENGGRPIFANDEHFGVLGNIMAPGRGINMGDGWETRRRREPGNDWSIVALGHAGEISSALIDTAHFKGNYPSGIMLQAALVEGDESGGVANSENWPELMPKRELSADNEHIFDIGINALGPVSHVRINIYPDGGISRLRLFGKPVK